MRVALVAAGLLFASLARAEDKAACKKSFADAQSLRDEGKLTAAREQMLLCTRTCPTAFQKLCEGWITDVEKSLPTIVLRAIDADGQDLVAVTVSIDGKKVAEKLDGKALALDPGTHQITFEASGRPPITKEIVVAQGEKNRTLLASFPAPPNSDTKEAKSTPPTDVPKPTAPVAAFVVGGLGVVALSGFAYFGLKGDSDHRALVDGCSRTSSCAQEDKDHVLREWRTADVFLASGVVLLGVGTYLYLTHESAPRAAVAIGPGHATLSVRF